MLAATIEQLTGRPALTVDARHFLDGGGGRVRIGDGEVGLETAAEGVSVVASMVIVYEIRPQDRRRFERFQHALRTSGVRTLGADVQAWRAATEKDLTAKAFLRDGIPHPETMRLTHPTTEQAVAAFEHLGGDVWARPVVGMGGVDVSHIVSSGQMIAAVRHFAAAEQGWLISRDAGNFDAAGRRHQYRVVVLEDRVLRAAEHVQPDPNAPCNQSRGAVSTDLPIDHLPPGLAELAVSATKSVGLPFAGVDLVPENGGTVFEVNVHPEIPANRADCMAIPYLEAHFAIG
ncbi:ATP-grasp domain-containing protein [Nocardia sp. NPDC004711]